MYIKIYNLTVRRINLVMLNSFVSLNQFFIESDNKNNNNNNNNNNNKKQKKTKTKRKQVGFFSNTRKNARALPISFLREKI